MLLIFWLTNAITWSRLNLQPICQSLTGAKVNEICSIPLTVNIILSDMDWKENSHVWDGDCPATGVSWPLFLLPVCKALGLKHVAVCLEFESWSRFHKPDLAPFAGTAASESVASTKIIVASFWNNILDPNVIGIDRMKRFLHTRTGFCKEMQTDKRP